MLDLEKPTFTQAAVLKLAPGLSAKSLQNWIARGIIGAGEKPGRQGKLRYDPLSVIELRLLVQMTDFGIPPSLAARWAEAILPQVEDFIDRHPLSISDGGIEQYRLDASGEFAYRQTFIWKTSDGWRCDTTGIKDRDHALDRILRGSAAYLVIESDITFALSLNAMIRLLSVRDDVERGEG